MQLKIEEGTYCNLPHFYITHGTYAHTQRRVPTPYNTTPLSGEENMLVALCERVLDLTAVNTSLRDLAAPAGSHIVLCAGCIDIKGIAPLDSLLDTHVEHSHCECCGRFGLVWQVSRTAAMTAYCKVRVESRREAREATIKPPPKHYYELRASSHENKVKILEWMRDGVAEMDNGEDGWFRSDVLYPNALYRKLVTDKDGYLTDPDFISAQVKAGNVWVKDEGDTDWTEPLFSSVPYIDAYIRAGRKYKLSEDV